MSFSDLLEQLMDKDDEKEIRHILPQLRMTDGTVHYNMYRTLRTPY